MSVNRGHFSRWHPAVVAAIVLLGMAAPPLRGLVGPTAAGAATGLSVTDLDSGSTASGLANSLVGSGLSVSNVTYTGANRAAGTFTGGTGIIGFDSGIVLGSGNVQTYSTDGPCTTGVEGPNGCYEVIGATPEGPDGVANTTAFGTQGDSDLSTLAGYPTNDAAVLEFDFVPKFSTVQFKYVFSSEEYGDYSNTQFNDVFGFLVNGANCALIPGTTQPVSINTVNIGNDQAGDHTPQNPQYFVNNLPPTLNTQMDGLTTVLSCNATVNANQTNHMKLAIADGSDEALDSAVFLQAQSFSSGTTISTSLSGGGTSGATISVPTATAVTDTATLGGANASTAGGTVTYTVYSDSGCTNSAGSGGTVAVTNGVAAPSNAVTQAAEGTYYWRAVYSGDTLNNGVTSQCGSEIETVATPPAQQPTTITTSLSGGGQTGTTISVPTDTMVHDSAALAGNNVGTATGTVTYQVYADPTCTTGPASLGTKTVTAGVVPDSDPANMAAGTWYWKASYSGDSTHTPASSCNEIETVSQVVVNHLPVASNQSVSTNQNTPVGVTLAATDADSDPLTYSVVTGPAHGALSGTAPNLTYTPTPGYVGPDSFTFKANDGKGDSNVATVSVTVNTVTTTNRPPVADMQCVSTPKDTAVPIILSGSDPDGDALTYSVDTGPAHGSLSGTAPALTYTPSSHFKGSDSFTFTVNDGKVSSAAAEVSIGVTKHGNSADCRLQHKHGHGKCKWWNVSSSHHHDLKIRNNDKHGWVAITVWVDGRKFSLGNLKSGPTKVFDIGRYMKGNGHDVVTLDARGSHGGSDVSLGI